MLRRIRSAGLLIALLFIAAFASLAAQEVELLWRQSIVIPETLNETLVDAATTSDGPVAVLINAVNGFGAPVVYMARVEQDGTIRWIRQVLATGAQRPFARLLAADSAGGAIAVVMDSAHARGAGCAVVRLDRYGQHSWSVFIPDLNPLQVVSADCNKVGVWGYHGGDIYGHILGEDGAEEESASIVGSEFPAHTLRLAARAEGDIAVLFSAMGGGSASLSCALYRFDGPQYWHVSPYLPFAADRYATAVGRNADGDVLMAAMVVNGSDTTGEIGLLDFDNGFPRWVNSLRTAGRPLSISRIAAVPTRIFAAGPMLDGGSFVQTFSLIGDSLWRSTLADTRFESLAPIGDHSAILAGTAQLPDKSTRMRAVIYGASSAARLSWTHDTLSFGRAAGTIGPNIGWLAGDVVPGGGGERKMPTLIAFTVPTPIPVGPRPEIAMGELNFGKVSVGSTARRTLPAIIRNTGDAPFTITEVEITGETDRFSLEGLAQGTVVAPFSAAGGRISFSPDAPSTMSITIKLTIDSTIVRSMVVIGRGAIWSLDAPVAAVDFGTVRVLQRYDSTLTYVNDGTEPVRVTRVDIVGSNQYEMITRLTLPLEVQPGASLGVRISFHPMISGVHTATLKVGADSVPSTVDIAMTGVGEGEAGVEEAAERGRWLVVPSGGPGPFTLSLESTEVVPVGFTVYDALGIARRRLASRVSEGRLTASWDGRDAKGNRCASGVYFIVADHGGSRVPLMVHVMR